MFKQSIILSFHDNCPNGADKPISTNEFEWLRSDSRPSDDPYLPGHSVGKVIGYVICRNINQTNKEGVSNDIIYWASPP